MHKFWNLYYRIANPTLFCTIEVVYDESAVEKLNVELPFNEYLKVHKSIEYQMKFKRLGEALDKIKVEFTVDGCLTEYTMYNTHRVKLHLNSPEKIIERLN